YAGAVARLNGRRSYLQRRALCLRRPSTTAASPTIIRIPDDPPALPTRQLQDVPPPLGVVVDGAPPAPELPPLPLLLLPPEPPLLLPPEPPLPLPLLP